MTIKRYNGSMNIRKVVKNIIPTSLFRRIEPVGHLAEAVVANVRNGFPGKRLRVIGVTGTNGKTTTSFFIHRMLHEAGVKVALMSTVAYGIGDDIKMQQEHITTAQAGILQKRLKSFADAGVEWVVLETSSHALAQHRVWGVPYEIAVMTNITHDHIDYHGTFERYLEAKRSLFSLANKRGLKYGVVNADDPNAKVFIDSVENSTTYGIENGELQASNLSMNAHGSSYIATTGGDVYKMKVNIPGKFNVSNSLAAVAVGRKLGLSKEQIEMGIAKLTHVEGRMNSISEGQPYGAIIDYASTPDGFEKLFSSIRPTTKGKLVAVFGSAGERDESKRAEQGRIAAQYADELVITEEDDRKEDGAKILNQIASGAESAGKEKDKSLFLVPDRIAAVEFALSRVKNPEDVVVFLGKGHEKTIERADGEHPWNENEVVRAAIKRQLKSQ